MVLLALLASACVAPPETSSSAPSLSPTFVAEARSAPPTVPSSPGGARASSRPLSNELLLRYEFFADSPGDPHPAFTLLADRRLITVEGLGGYPALLMERRLTAAGVRAVLDRVRDTRLFDRSARYSAERLPGAEPPVHGAALHVFTLRDGGSEVQVSAVPPFADPKYYRPAPEVSRLSELARALQSLDSWLPPEAWLEQQRRPFAAHTILVFVLPSPYGRSTSPMDLAALERVLGSRAETFGDRIPNGLRCAPIDDRKFSEIVGALAHGGHPDTYAPGASTFFVSLNSKETDATYLFGFVPLLPDRAPTCSDPRDSAFIR